jgi:hypothetical protein
LGVSKPLNEFTQIQSDPVDEEEAVDINRELIVDENSKINIHQLFLSVVDYLEKLKFTL